MLEKLQLTNFRKHEDLVLDFVGGLNVVRGSNEAGKSTLQEAVGYALFGSKALRTTFADTVTWGRPESTLKVSLTVVLGGRKFTFARGKSGAEVIEDGRVTVTGQTEVTNYAAGLLGCDGTAAANLIIASQNAMRGSLEQGPKATAALIEQLADFDLFDVLIERIQSNLIIGAPAAFEAKVREAEERLQESKPVAKPDDVAYSAALSEISNKIASVQSALTDKLRPDLRAAEKAYELSEQQLKAHGDALGDVARAENTLNGHREQRQSFAMLAANLMHDPATLATAKADLVALEKVAGAADAYAVFKSLPTCEHEFDEDVEAFSKWLEGRRADLTKTNDLIHEKLARHRELQASIINSSTCGFCGQDVSAFPDVAKKNAEAKDEIDVLIEDTANLRGQVQGITIEIEAGKAIEAATRKVQAALPKLGDYVEVDHGFTPPRVAWSGEAPGDVNLKPARDLVSKLEKDAAQAQQYAASASALITIIEEDGHNLKHVKDRLAACPAPENRDDLYDAYLNARDQVQACEEQIEELREHSEELRSEFTTATVLYGAYAGEQTRLKAAVVSAKKDLEDLAFNNALLKKVRTARPIIADKLWNTVLAAVSTMFSQMRGDASVVSKDNGGFKVNGQPIEALSGSTLDILGLAIRTALVKTFIPHAPFMLLDEAAAACDEDRTGSLLGFVAGSGFEQVVLVTHESASEAVADNVIQL